MKKVYVTFIKYLYLVVTVMCLLVQSDVALAGTSDNVQGIIEVKLDSEQSASTAVTKLNGVVADVSSSSGNTLYLYPSAISDLSSADQRSAVDDMALAIRETNIKKEDKNRINTGVTELWGSVASAVELLDSDVSEEIKEATVWYNWIAKYTNPVLGFILYFIIFGAVLAFFIDISYLTVPIVRGLLDMTARNEGEKPRFLVTKEAYRCVIDTEGTDNRKIALIEYFKKTWVQYSVLVVVILYMLRGSIFAFMGWVLDLFSGFMG